MADTKSTKKKTGRKKIRIVKRTSENSKRKKKSDAAVAAEASGGTKKKKKKKKRIFLKVILVLFVLALIGGLCGLGLMITWMSEAPDLDLSKFTFTETSMVYDYYGNPYQELQTSEKRIPVDIDDISETVQLAFISIEDQRYYSHFGVDIRGTGRAIVNVLLSGSTDGPGGSTITQQLIKQTHLSSVTSIKRKVMEWKLAYELEQAMNKRDILAAYLNKVNMSQTWGIESAAQLYFGVSNKELSVAQSCVLAAIVKSPSFYNPWDYEKDEDGVYHLVRIQNEDGTVTIGYDSDNMERAILVAAKMYELGHINREEYEIAKYELQNNLIGLIEPKSNTTYTYFTDAVYSEVLKDLMETYNYTTDQAVDLLLNGGLRIYSTVIPEIQTALEEQAAKSSNFPEQSSAAKKVSELLTEERGEEVNYIPQVGGAIIENDTGYVVGIIGGREKTGSLTLNRALQKFQVGSTTKPISTYSPGIDTGVLTLGTTFNDVLLKFDGNYTPHDANSMKGMITVRQALTSSVNIVAVQAERTVGHQTCAEYAEKFGFDITWSGYNNDLNSAALALGGYTYGQSPLAVASAYTVFPNGGYRVTPTFYTKVTDSNGVVILESHQETVQVISEQTAWLITSCLKNVVRGGTTNRSVPGQEIGGKTGTTNNLTYAWFAGFTAKYSGAFWYGYDQMKVTVDGKEYNLRIGQYGGRSAAVYWEAVFRQFYSEMGLESAKLPSRPSGIFSAAIDSVSGKAPTELSYLDPRGSQVISEYFIDGTYPSGSDDMHQYVEVCAETGLLATEYCPVESRVFVVKDPELLYHTNCVEVDPDYVPEPEEGALAPRTYCTTHTSNSYVTSIVFTDQSGTRYSDITLNSQGESVTYNVLSVRNNGTTSSTTAIEASSDHGSVATVTYTANTITINAVANGTATITVRSVYNAGTSLEYTVTGEIIVRVDIPDTFAITVGSAEHGSITGAGQVLSVSAGSSQAITATADSGYVINSLTVDGEVVSEASDRSTYTYTFTNISSNHSISVTFKQVTSDPDPGTDPDPDPDPDPEPDPGTDPGVSIGKAWLHNRNHKKNRSI